MRAAVEVIQQECIGSARLMMMMPARSSSNLSFTLHAHQMLKSQRIVKGNSKWKNYCSFFIDYLDTHHCIPHLRHGCGSPGWEPPQLPVLEGGHIEAPVISSLILHIFVCMCVPFATLSIKILPPLAIWGHFCEVRTFLAGLHNFKGHKKCLSWSFLDSKIFFLTLS